MEKWTILMMGCWHNLCILMRIHLFGQHKYQQSFPIPCLLNQVYKTLLPVRSFFGLCYKLLSTVNCSTLINTISNSNNVETFPRFDTATNDDRTRRVIFSCFLRFVQGGMAIFSSFVLVVNSSNVIEIILNFTAVNFISNIDGKNSKLMHNMFF